MKEYKKLDLKNDHGADNLVHHLNEGWDIFREFPGWLIVFKDKEDVVSPAAEPEKPVFRPHAEWFEMLKEPLRSQALEALKKFPLGDSSQLSSSIAEAFSAAFSWKGVGAIDKWGGVYDFFEGRIMLLSNSEYGSGYELAKQCAPDGWEKSKNAGE